MLYQIKPYLQNELLFHSHFHFGEGEQDFVLIAGISTTSSDHGFQWLDSHDMPRKCEFVDETLLNTTV